MKTLDASTRILIAEDDRTSRAMLKAILQKWGFDLMTADNGAKAWEILQCADAPRLLLIDWNMPEMDGVDVIRRVRAMETVELPYIIMLTSKAEKSSIVVGLDAGANDYIIKPYDPEELRARLRVGQRMLELQTALRIERDARALEAMHDPLTGARNRRAILETLSRELFRAQREDSIVCVGICDIDHFKGVNDTYGHQVGDEVLCSVVRLLQSNLREYDHLGRWGGEEFLVIAPGRIELNAVSLFERMRVSCANTPLLSGVGKVPITISIGVAVWNGEDSRDALLAAADIALYQAKNQGRNCICLAEERLTVVPKAGES